MQGEKKSKEKVHPRAVDNIKYFKTPVVRIPGQEKDSGIEDVFEGIASRDKNSPRLLGNHRSKSSWNTKWDRHENNTKEINKKHLNVYSNH